MKTKPVEALVFSLLFVVILAGISPHAQSATGAKNKAEATQPTFAAPEEAASALIEAARASDRQKVFALIGPGSSAWLPSGDAAMDREHWTRFLAAYDQKHVVEKGSDEQLAILTVGEDNWPFPAPLVRHGERWQFDAKAGREEVIRRRIGRNELDAMQTLLAIVDAQREYAAGDPDGNGSHDYARRFISTPGKHDGLYWPVAEGETPSPLGPLVGAAAAAQGKEGRKHPPRGSYHGYRYRLLESQGKDAPGGAYSYRVGNRLLGGFAVVAFPEKQNVTGIMTFVVNHDGVVYEKDLGAKSENQALKMKTFNPDSTWTKAE